MCVFDFYYADKWRGAFKPKPLYAFRSVPFLAVKKFEFQLTKQPNICGGAFVVVAGADALGKISISQRSLLRN